LDHFRDLAFGPMIRGTGEDFRGTSFASGAAIDDGFTSATDK
jgi:hypothetical protein